MPAPAAASSPADPNSPPADSPAVTALAAGLWRCAGCAAVCEPPAAALAQGRTRCPRCDAAVHPRKPDSIARSWAYLLAATALYLPANLLPVTHTASIAGRSTDTIFSGIVYLWHDGSFALAVIVFIASIVVPVTKLLVLSLLLISLQRQETRWLRQRLQAFRLLEMIGRWSMLDVFVVTMLSSLVQVESLAELEPRPGAIAFGAVVVLTMLATHAFDPRLLFDRAEDGAPAAASATASPTAATPT
ncbi:MAG: paraquat-inducible protein A [Burkholderiaceae bacterium]